MPLKGLSIACALLALTLVGSVHGLDDRPLNLFEWMAPAQEVLSGTVLGRSGKWARIRVERVLRGASRAGEEIRIDVRGANRERGDSRPALRLDDGGTYLFLLTRLPIPSDEGTPAFGLTRNVEGSRELPREGADAWLRAAERLCGIQALKSESLTWEALGALLTDANPVLVETAIDLHLKFRRPDRGILPAARRLLEGPRPDWRARAAEMIGIVIESRQLQDAEEIRSLIADLTARARRDGDAGVREAATRALGRIQDPAVDGILAEIARDDAEQRVRYAAARSILERQANRPASGGPSNADDRR